jgi:hypothetical protein
METMISSLDIRGTGILGLCLLISACATFEPVPKGYSGATAKLTDSAASDADSERCASFFFLGAYDGHDVENSFAATEQRNRGRGMSMTIEGYSRLVPAQEATFHLKARTHCAAPILEVTHKIYIIEGDVKFAPQADGQYTIKGELGEDHSAIWVEDLATGKQRGNKLLVKGSAALNRGALLLLGEAAAKSSNQKVEEIPPQ